MDRRLFRDSFGWGFVLWLVGYVLGIALFFALPSSMIGWAIMPIGVAVALWVLLKKVAVHTFTQFLVLAVVWTGIAVLFDYIFIVRTFAPADGYYKLDVYLYYGLTFLLPAGIGWMKERRGYNP